MRSASSRLGIAVLVAAALVLFWLLRPAPPEPPRPAVRRPNPIVPAPPPPAAPRPVTPAPVQPESGNGEHRQTLSDFLDRLGRAVVTGDTKRTAELREKAPPFYATDIEWLLQQIQGELFRSAGAAEASLLFGLREAIPVLDDRLWTTTSLPLKDQLIRVLSLLGGDAEARLVSALRRETEASVRARITRHLGRFTGNLSMQALVGALRNDPNSAVRLEAARALSSYPAGEVLALLLESLPMEQDRKIRTMIARAAYTVGGAEILPRLRELIRSDPGMEWTLLEEQKRSDLSRYAARYPRGFFDPGMPGVAWEPGTMERIGITMDVRDAGGMTFRQAVEMLFTTSPLDRYRTFFYLRDAASLEEELLRGVARPSAWDAHGVPVSGGLPLGTNENVVYVRFLDPSRFGPRIEGYTEGREANVSLVSLLHEFGHAFAQLADEYDSPAASDAGGANIDGSDEPLPKWQSLVDGGHLEGQVLRRGAKRIPSGNCYMNNRTTDSRWCPVCQLELIARINSLTGVPLPW